MILDGEGAGLLLGDEGLGSGYAEQRWTLLVTDSNSGAGLHMHKWEIREDRTAQKTLFSVRKAVTFFLWLYYGMDKGTFGAFSIGEEELLVWPCSSCCIVMVTCPQVGSKNKSSQTALVLTSSCSCASSWSSCATFSLFSACAHLTITTEQLLHY